MITLEISESFHSQVDSDLIEETALATLRHQSVNEGSELTIVITSDEQIHTLNRQFLDIDAPTDVLSFPAGFLDPENEVPYLGDVIISFPCAESQAAVGGHAVMAELQLLVVHGVLHLLGYDHAEQKEKAVMWTAQEEILHRMGLVKLKISEGE